jgi:hypothetical protein
MACDVHSNALRSQSLYQWRAAGSLAVLSLGRHCVKGTPSDEYHAR